MRIVLVNLSMKHDHHNNSMIKKRSLSRYTFKKYTDLRKNHQFTKKTKVIFADFAQKQNKCLTLRSNRMYQLYQVFFSYELY